MGKERIKTRGDKVIDWIETYCRVPEGKLIGQPIKLREWQRKAIKGIYDSPTRRAIISYGRKNGKGLALDTPIPTSVGWKTIGDIVPGDYVIGSDGNPTKVLFVSDTHTNLRCWRVTFSDGSSVVADEQHQWETIHSYRPWAKTIVRGSGNGGRWSSGVVTTPQIAESVYRKRKDGGKEHNHKINAAPAIGTVDIFLPIDPYVLGAWLGDGTSASATFTAGNVDVDYMVDRISFLLKTKAHKYRSDDSRAWTIRTPGSGLQKKLREHGLLKNKHIPDVYFNSGTSQRLALLQGLMDTDGTVSLFSGSTTPRASFSSTKRELAYGVWRLARSLGFKANLRKAKAKLNGVICGDQYIVAFAAKRDEQVFSLDRKQKLLPNNLGSRSRTLTIVSCDEVESVPTKCLTVDAPNKLFLIGHGCIPTHNTALAAALLLVHLAGPEARPNGQLFSAAKSRDQAALLFSLAAKMVRLNPDLAQYVTIRDSTKQLFCAELGTLYRALSAEATTAYGLSPVFIVHDELGQIRGPKSELYDALETACGAQENPLSIIISTQAPTDADLLSVLIDDAATNEDPLTKLFLFAADPEDDPFDEATIRKANPAFGDFQNATEVLATAASAKRMPAMENSYRNLVLNQRVSPHTTFVSRSVWESCGQLALEESYLDGEVYVGLDLSARNDLTALVIAARYLGEWHVRCEFFTPEIGLSDRAHAARAPYEVWVKQGWLTVVPGSSIDYTLIAQRLVEIAEEYNVQRIAFDRWRIDVLQADLSRLGVDYLPMVPFGQGFKDMSPALDVLEAELLSGRIRHGNNPMLTWCVANATVTSDPANNKKFDKAKSSGKIDGIVALAMAIGSAGAAIEATPVPQMEVWV